MATKSAKPASAVLKYRNGANAHRSHRAVPLVYVVRALEALLSDLPKRTGRPAKNGC